MLLRDLPSLYGIQDIQELNSLFTTLAFNSADEVSLEALSKDSGVSKNTLKKYIEYLEAAFLIRKVHRVDENARRFILLHNRISSRDRRESPHHLKTQRDRDKKPA